jgi:hypothetical protein
MGGGQCSPLALLTKWCTRPKNQPPGQIKGLCNDFSISPLKTEGILRQVQKSDITHPRVEGFKKIMVPPESLSQYLSNEHQ